MAGMAWHGHWPWPASINKNCKQNATEVFTTDLVTYHKLDSPTVMRVTAADCPAPRLSRPAGLPLPESGHPGDQVALHDLEAAIQRGDPAAVACHLADTGLECRLPVAGGPSPAMLAASLGSRRLKHVKCLVPDSKNTYKFGFLKAKLLLKI
jgi:hypothetical protein